MKKFLNSTPPESNQDAFNKILAWLTRPDASLCGDGEGGCWYRSLDGNNACAIGTLMPTKLARAIDNTNSSSDISSNGVTSVLETRPAAKKWFAKCDVEFLAQMQAFHDDNMFCDSKTKCLDILEAVADKYKLKIPKDITAFFSK